MTMRWGGLFIALFVIFPITFFMANFGAGAAVIIGIHALNTTRLIVTLTTLVSIGCAAVLIRLAASFLPAAAAQADAETSTEATIDRALAGHSAG